LIDAYPVIQSSKIRSDWI